MRPGTLSQRELEVLELVAAGNTNRDIAGKLFLSEATVKSHLLNLYAKLESTTARPPSPRLQPRLLHRRIQL